jgi:hypothetical protein
MITLIASVERRSSEVQDGERDPFYKAAHIMHLHRLRSVAARKWSMALRQNDRSHRYIANRNGALCPGMRGTLQGHPAAGIQWGMGKESAGLPCPCGRLIGDPSGRWRRVASTGGAPLCYHLLAICIDHTKESSSHRHKHCQINDWGLLGADRTRGFPDSIYWPPAGKGSASSQQVVIVIRSSAQKQLLISPGVLHLSM